MRGPRARAPECRRTWRHWAGAFLTAYLVASATAATLDDARLASADGDADNWLSHGRTPDEQRYSPLAQIDTRSVQRLGLAWSFDFPEKRGVESTPLVVDGVLYVTGPWSVVHAFGAASGRRLWTYDPAVERRWARYACCDAVNRGVAAWGGQVYVGTLDGYLVAIDRRTGRPTWRVDTIARHPGYTITGAPRIANGLVIIGNGGAEYGVRGYVSAYDARDGSLRWRFYTVPGGPGDHDDATLQRARTTWTGQWWRLGGGGTVWDSIAFDPQLDLLYVGVGNGSPWNQRLRSPGGGDNLFLSSIVALKARSGEYVWHYQTTPAETWDYTATQPMILADLEVEGRPRKLLMQAPKNGFFYVLDRTNGKLVSARHYVPVSWARGVDPRTGRPREVAAARYRDGGPVVVEPSGGGGHNWHPMSFSPRTRLVYFSSQRVPDVFAADRDFRPQRGFWNVGVDLASKSPAQVPEPALDVPGYAVGTSRLHAWDPLRQVEAWHHDQPFPSRAGVLSTGGDLVFQGSFDGEFAAFDARDGRKLWSFQAGTAIMAAPISFAIDGVQHVAIAAGWGGGPAMGGGPLMERLRPAGVPRLLVFRLDGKARLPARDTPVPVMIDAASVAAQSPMSVIEAQGDRLFHRRCAVCHGWDAISGGINPDLRWFAAAPAEAWKAIVHDGAREPNGMPAFRGSLSQQDIDAIHAYVKRRAAATLPVTPTLR